MAVSRGSNGFPILAPVELEQVEDQAVAHSLAVLSTVYHYNHWIFDMVRPHLGPRTLEVGSGVGNITQFLLNLRSVTCLEPFEPYRDYLRRRFEDHSNVRVLAHPIEACPNDDVPPGAHDSVICLNVLEHLRDDADALFRMRRLAAPGGRVVVLVPAMPSIFGRMDEAMGHLRRYRGRGLRELFRRVGLRPVLCRHANLAGALAWWWRGRVLRRERIPESATRLFDRMVPVISAAERMIPPPLGQSLLCVGRA